MDEEGDAAIVSLVGPTDRLVVARRIVELFSKGASVGISILLLGVATGTGLAGGSTGTNVPSARASVTALGGLQLGTNELIGEDPSVVIRLVPAS